MRLSTYWSGFEGVRIDEELAGKQVWFTPPRVRISLPPPKWKKSGIDEDKCGLQPAVQDDVFVALPLRK